MKKATALAERTAHAREPKSEHHGDFEVTIRDNVLWCILHDQARRSVTLAQLKSARAIDEKLLLGSWGTVTSKVISSRVPGVFSLGGDLRFFLDCIQKGDRSSLTEYALLAIRAVWSNASGLAPRKINTLAVLQGEAQGGGFEAALSCDMIIAERGAHCGFPESLFGMFPGMGAEALLNSRVDRAVAQKIVKSANRYTTEFLFEIGVIDKLVAKGTGLVVASNVTSNPSQFDFENRRKRRLMELSLTDLVEGVERWVDQAFALSKNHLRAITYIVAAQDSNVTAAA